jgi:hypothetical protein
MSSTDYLFSGADPTGRDDLAPRGSVKPGRSGLAGNVVRTARTLTLGAATVFAAQFAVLSFTTPARADVSFRIDDATLDAVRSARSRGEPPTPESRSTAAELVLMLRRFELEPERVLADPDGGIALYVFGGAARADGSRVRYARVLASNTGEVAILFVDRDRTTSPHALDVGKREREAAITRVREFLGHSGHAALRGSRRRAVEA